MNKETIARIEVALKHHKDYNNNHSIFSKYFDILDPLAAIYEGAISEKISKLLDDYFINVGVDNLQEALNRLRKQETN